MIGWYTVLIGIWIAFAAVLAAYSATAKWVLKADYVDACSCDLACPCISEALQRMVIARKEIMAKSILPV